MRDFVMGAGNSYSVLIVSYELFRKHTDALSQLNNLLLICDEGASTHRQRIKRRAAVWRRNADPLVLVLAVPPSQAIVSNRRSRTRPSRR